MDMIRMRVFRRPGSDHYLALLPRQVENLLETLEAEGWREVIKTQTDDQEAEHYHGA
jgi:hypothetical protein